MKLNTTLCKWFQESQGGDKWPMVGGGAAAPPVCIHPAGRRPGRPRGCRGRVGRGAQWRHSGQDGGHQERPTGILLKHPCQI